MPLSKLESFYQNYKEAFEGNDVKALDLYTEGQQKIGSVDEVLVDQDGRFRYLVITPEAIDSDKQILLPIGLSRIAYPEGRVYVDGLSKEQVEQLPEYQDDMAIDEYHERQIRIVYSGEKEQKTSQQSDRETEVYTYEQYPSLYELNEKKHGKFKIFEDRLRIPR